MIETILTIYIVLGLVQVGRELCVPYGGSFLLFSFLLGPYLLVVDFIHDYKEARELEKGKLSDE